LLLSLHAEIERQAFFVPSHPQIGVGLFPFELAEERKRILLLQLHAATGPQLVAVEAGRGVFEKESRG
jgi:hypothetical protein